jgi:HlyD family secretion protein
VFHPSQQAAKEHVVKPIPFLVGCAFSAIAAGAFVFLNQHWLQGMFSESSDKTAHEPAVTAVAALGRLEPVDEVHDVSGPSGAWLEKLLVEEGDWVEAGTPLAHLDGHNENLAARDYAQSRLNEAKKRFAAETDYGMSQVEEAKLGLRQVEEVALLAIQAQEAQVRRDQADIEKANFDYQRSKQMLQTKAISQSQLDSVNLYVRQSEAQCERDKLLLAQLKLEREVNLKLAQARVETAQANLARAQIATQLESL